MIHCKHLANHIRPLVLAARHWAWVPALNFSHNIQPALAGGPLLHCGLLHWERLRVRLRLVTGALPGCGRQVSERLRAGAGARAPEGKLRQHIFEIVAGLYLAR